MAKLAHAAATDSATCMTAAGQLESSAYVSWLAAVTAAAFLQSRTPSWAFLCLAQMNDWGPQAGHFLLHGYYGTGL